MMAAAEPVAAVGEGTAASAPGPARSRRLWDLPLDSHGPIVGSCLPVAELRRLMDKLFAGRSAFDDFELHAAAVAQCATRNKVSQALQRELDRRHADTLRRFAAAGSAQALASMWAAALGGADVAAALWAALSHAHCDEALQLRIHRELYVLQHERVALARHDAAALAALRAENLALHGEGQRLRQRHALWRSDAMAERQALQQEVLALRAQVAAQQALIVQSPVPLPCPPTPGRDALVQRVAELSRQLLLAQRMAVARPEVQRSCDEHAATMARPVPPAAQRRDEADAALPPAISAGTALQSTRVLCVGGRSGQVPSYRRWVERQGGRFAHHDGGIEDNPQRLDAQLAAADLVVCQAGCLNHNAYARVKEHCKRSGKPCVYLDKPGASSFVRALARGPLRALSAGASGGTAVCEAAESGRRS